MARGGGSKKRSAPQSRRGTSSVGGSTIAETPLNAYELRAVRCMYDEYPTLKTSNTSFMARMITAPFTIEIPALGFKNNSDMDAMIASRWMPWVHKMRVYCLLYGICPVYMEKVGEHQVPVTPDMEMGYITVSISREHKLVYKWYWCHGTSTECASDMMWVMTEHTPAADGTLRSPCKTLLTEYRMLRKLAKNHTVAATQRSRPVHLIETTASMRAPPNDNLTTLQATFSKAAGIGKARREMAEEAEYDMRRLRMMQSLGSMGANGQRAARKTLWTDTDQEVLDEMDNGFSDRVIVMRPDTVYKTAAMPELVGDYQAAAARFDIMAAAVMDFSMQLLIPTGVSRTQNSESSMMFMNDRIRRQNSFFTSILQSLVVIAYRKQFAEIMDHARQWRLSRLQGDPMHVQELFPELDVIVKLSSSAIVGDEDARSMRMDGIMTQDDMGRQIYDNHNLGHEKRVNLKRPDNIPEEEADEMIKKSKKKKPKKD